MNETWESSVNIQARRLANTAHQLALGFYQLNNFYIQPTLIKHPGSKVIIFPDLAYHTIRRFWDHARHISVAEPINSACPLVLSLQNLLKQSHDISFEPRNHSVKSAWEKAKADILKEIKRLIPLAESIEVLHILPTPFGSIASFNRFDPAKGIIEIYLRADANLYDLVDGLVGSLVHSNSSNNLYLGWSEKEAVCDWLAAHSSLSVVLQKYESSTHYPTIASLRRIQSHHRLALETEVYLSKLGLPSSLPQLKMKNEQIFVSGKLLDIVNTKERAVLTALIQKKSLSNDELADMLFPNEDDFSLYVQAKFIERLRHRLEEHGVSGSLIQTVRGQGLVLRN